jgi:hypothetical protein
VKLGLCAVLCALFTTASARAESVAQATAPGLNWIRLPGAEDCLTSAELAERVEQRAGRVLFAPATQAELFVDGYVSRGAGAYTVQLQVSKRAGEVLGERTLEITGERCEVIDEAVTLVIAVTLYPRSALIATGIPLDDATAASLHALFGDEPTDPDPSSLPAPAADAKAKAHLGVQGEATSIKGAPSAKLTSWQLGIDLAVGAGLGELPVLTPAIAAHVRVVPPELWPIELSAQRSLVSTAELRRGAGALDMELLAAGLTACPWTLLSQDARLCVGARVGVLTVAPRDLAVPAAKSREAAFDLTIGVAYRPRIVGPLHFRMEVQGGVPLIQHQLVYEARDGTQTRAFSTAPVVGQAELGLGLTF